MLWTSSTPELYCKNLQVWMTNRKNVLPLGLERHLPYTWPRALRCLSWQPSLQPKTCKNGQQHQNSWFLNHIRFQSTYVTSILESRRFGLQIRKIWTITNKIELVKKSTKHACERIIGPPWDWNNLSAFIIPTIFSVNLCIAFCNIQHCILVSRKKIETVDYFSYNLN